MEILFTKYVKDIPLQQKYVRNSISLKLKGLHNMSLRICHGVVAYLKFTSHFPNYSSAVVLRSLIFLNYNTESSLMNLGTRPT